MHLAFAAFSNNPSNDHQQITLKKIVPLFMALPLLFFTFTLLNIDKYLGFFFQHSIPIDDHRSIANMLKCRS